MEFHSNIQVPSRTLGVISGISLQYPSPGPDPEGNFWTFTAISRSRVGPVGSFLEFHCNIQVPGRTRGSFLEFHSNIQVPGRNRGGISGISLQYLGPGPDWAGPVGSFLEFHPNIQVPEAGPGGSFLEFHSNIQVPGRTRGIISGISL